MENNELAPVNQGLVTQKLTAKQEKFCSEFIKDFNASAAARRAGYSAATSSNIGWENVRKREIKDRIAILIKEASMQPEEIKKRMSDIARADLSDYIINRPVEHTPKVKKGLKELISDLKKEIDFEDNYALEVNLVGKDLTAHQKGQDERRRLAIRYKLELAEDPTAYRIIDGKTTLVDSPELDIVALSQAKGKGQIKSFKMTKDGPQVELYAADGALANLARVYAMFIDRTEVDLVKKMEDMSIAELDEVLNIVTAKFSNPNQNQNDYIEI
jgi:phage terminase small subunit